MVNETLSFNFENITNLNNVFDNTISQCSFTFKQAILNTCNDWKGYSTNAHDFYIWLIFGISILGILKNTFKINPKITILKNTKYEEIVNVIDWFRSLGIGIIFIRIMQVWYILNYILV